MRQDLKHSAENKKTAYKRFFYLSLMA